MLGTDLDSFDYLEMTAAEYGNLNVTCESHDYENDGYYMDETANMDALDRLLNFAETYKERLQAATFHGPAVRYTGNGVIVRAKVGGLLVSADEIAVLDETGEVYATA